MVVDYQSEREIDRLFHALADSTRRDILVRAIEMEQSVSALARRYEMSFAAVQKHVAVLERAALVTKERRGREQIVHSNTATLRKATALLDAYERLWIERADKITDVLAGEEGDPDMTVISTIKDVEELRLTLVAEFGGSPDRVWEVWENPRKLEKWWGPPTYPATFTRHDFVVGGESRYFMTGPAGNTSHGWWRIEAIDKPHLLEFANGLAGEDGEPVPGMEPMAGHVTFETVDGGTRMTAITNFADVKQMETMLGMGMQEGTTQAIRQIDALLERVTVWHRGYCSVLLLTIRRARLITEPTSAPLPGNATSSGALPPNTC